MNNSKSGYILKLSTTGLLIAVGIVIPMFMPVKIVLEPASFTLASHVAIFMAMFISPYMAAAVALGTTAGFFLGGFPVVIVIRAATHLIFAVLGAGYIKKYPGVLNYPARRRLFSFCAGIVHGFCELIAVTFFYYGGNLAEAWYNKGYWYSVVLLVGAGTLVHSMVDFSIALIIKAPLEKTAFFKRLAPGSAS